MRTLAGGETCGSLDGASAVHSELSSNTSLITLRPAGIALTPEGLLLLDAGVEGKQLKRNVAFVDLREKLRMADAGDVPFGLERVNLDGTPLPNGAGLPAGGAPVPAAAPEAEAAPDTVSVTPAPAGGPAPAPAGAP